LVTGDVSDAGDAIVCVKSYRILPIDEKTAQEIVAWRYPEPYQIYNISPKDAVETIAAFQEPAYQYFQIRDSDHHLVAFFNFGIDARVRGGDYSQDALDIGMGVHPALTGQGKGSHYARIVLKFARETLEDTVYRVTIAEFNQRARRVWEKIGFTQVQHFQRPMDGMGFNIFTADLSDLVLMDQNNS
jgi:ribosomal-protein-alanine N-acetyltransferase